VLGHCACAPCDAGPCWILALVVVVRGSTTIHPGAVAHRAGGGCWVVPRHCGALVLVFIVVGWLFIFVVGHGVCCFGAVIYNLKIMKTVS
jgi:hypothetical protein